MMLERPSEVTWTGHTVCDSKNLTQRERAASVQEPGSVPRGRREGRSRKSRNTHPLSTCAVPGTRPFASRISLNATVTLEVRVWRPFFFLRLQ